MSTPSPTALTVNVEAPDPWLIVVKLVQIVNYILAFLPNLAIAIAIVIFFWIIGRIVAYYVEMAMVKGKKEFSEWAIFAWTGIARWTFIILGVIVAALILFPNFNMSDLIAFLGVFSIALGLVFQELLLNTVAGLALVLSRPFFVGDHIEGGGAAGVVGDITIRATRLDQPDGTLYWVPNKDLYFGMIKINTHTEFRRAEYSTGIGYPEDIEEAKRVIVEAVKKAAFVVNDNDDYPVEAGCTDLGDSSVTIRVRWWAKPSEYWGSYGQTIQFIKEALDDNKIDIPYPIRTLYNESPPEYKPRSATLKED